jgi:hypothetical protein
MSNMSYCRFENTLSDLRDCELALEEETPESLAQMSEYERPARDALVKLCCKIARKYGKPKQEE